MNKRILVPVDGSTTSMNGLEKAIRLAKTSGAKLRILHVVDGIAFSRDHSTFTANAEKFRESGRKLIKELWKTSRAAPRTRSSRKPTSGKPT